MSENRDQKWHLRPRPLPIGHAPPNRPRLPLGVVKRRSHPLKFNWRSGATGDDVIRKHHVESVRSRRWPPWNGVHLGMGAMLQWRPCWNGVHLGMAANLVGAMLEWHPCWNGSHLGLAAFLEGSTLEGWPSWIGSHLGEFHFATATHLGVTAILEWPPSCHASHLATAPLSVAAAILAQHPSSWRRPSCPGGHPGAASGGG